MRYGIHLLLAILSTVSSAAEIREDVRIADFESETYPSGWVVTGEAFGPGPARGTLDGQMEVSGFTGERLVNTFFHGDATTGTLTSVPFTIERNYIRFLVGGGMDPERLTMNLLVDGQVVRTVTGPNREPGGTERLSEAQWDVSELIGKDAVVVITDLATGGWGHLNIDDIYQTDRRIPITLQNQRREFMVDRRYLILPVRTGAPMRRMTLSIGGRDDRTFDIELAETDVQADFHVSIDLSAYQGESIALTIDQIREDQLGADSGFGAITLADALPDRVPVYREKDRPSFHLTSRRGWNNDPNGMVYYRGKYHLFWQHNPFGWNWGNMHWAHAVSDDMVHWKELGDALIPDRFGPMFSGSAVTDWKNSSGLGTEENPPMVAAYTAAGSPTVQCMAYSINGKTLTKWDGNPIIDQITPGNRDPKLLWYAPGNHWVLVLYVERPVNERKEGAPIHTFRFFSSTDLKTWTPESCFDAVDMFECPDLFELPVLDANGEPVVDADGNPITKWVLYAADGQYLTGGFDGKTYTPDGGKQTLWYGRFYAAQTFSDTPDGRRIQIGWANGVTFPGMPFNQQMTIPVELSLRQEAEGHVHMCAIPIRELESLRDPEHASISEWSDGIGEPIRYETSKSDAEELLFTYERIDRHPVELRIHSVPLVYDPVKEELRCGDEANRVVAPLATVNGQIGLRVLIDRGSIEVFDTIGGKIAMSVKTQTEDEGLITEIPVDGLVKWERYGLKSIWRSASHPE
ncbi:MAG: 2,6-beta-D-fructofuranosidase [Planctomycetia bacterium]|nr:2,6-beta-D-fructofuranosidase [Planctomycetia bacterium]